MLDEIKNSNYTLNDLFKVDEDEDVVWSSSDESIARIEGRKIFFFKAGELDITGLGKKYKLHLVITEGGILNPETRNSFVIIVLSVITCIALFVIDKIYRKKKKKTIVIIVFFHNKNFSISFILSWKDFYLYRIVYRLHLSILSIFRFG